MGDIWKFIVAIGKRGLPLISGGIACLLGIAWPYLAAAIKRPEWSATVPLWLVIGVLALAVFVACFQAWRSEHLEVMRYEELVRPKLKCSFRPADPGCVRTGVRFSPIQQSGLNASITGPSSSSYSIMWGTSTPTPPAFVSGPPPPNSQIPVTYYRIRVEADVATQVSKCHGRLLKITRGNDVVFDGEPVDLPFAPSERAGAIDKTIHAKAPEFLDFLAISNDDKVFITTHEHMGSSSIDWDNLFTTAGEYKFHIAVLSESPTVGIEPVLKWTGNRLTSEMIWS